MHRGLSLLLLLWTFCSASSTEAESSRLPAAPLRSAFGSRCARSPLACNRIDYFTASFHLADIILLPATESRGLGATIGYGLSMSLFHRIEVGIGGTLALWNQSGPGLRFQNGPALFNIKAVLFPLLRNSPPDTEFTFGLQLQQQLHIPRFDGTNDLGTLSPLTALRAVADKPFWRMGVSGTLGVFFTQGRTDTELGASLRLHIPGMSRATVQGFGVLSGLFGAPTTAPLRGGFGLSFHVAFESGTSLSGGFVHGRGDGIAPSAIYLGGPDYRIGKETSEQSYARPPIPNRDMVPSPWPWLWERLQSEWNEAELANEAHRRGEDWLHDECFLYEDGRYDRPLRHLGRRDPTGKFCNLGGARIPIDEPLREVGGDLLPVNRSSSPSPAVVPGLPSVRAPTAPNVSAEPATQPTAGTTLTRAKRRKPQQREEPTAHVANAPPPEVPPLAVAPPPKHPPSSFGESAAQFARGFAHGVGAESRQIYHDTKQLPSQLAKTGREILEDIHASRQVRALAPLLAMEHALRSASRQDVERIAHATVDAAKHWLEQSAYEQGASLGRATTAAATEVAIDVLTDGIGSIASLRKAEKVAAAADHLRDAEKATRSVDKVERAGQLRGLLPEQGGPSAHIWPHEVTNKTPVEIDRRARQLGLVPRGPDPAMGRGAYVDPQTGIQRILSHPEATVPHAHVNDPAGKRIDKHGNPVPSESPAAHLPIKRPSH